MILYDASHNMRFQDYGIMLPISSSRAERVLDHLEGHFEGGTRGHSMPYPGPVFNTASALFYLSGKNTGITRKDLETVHSQEFIAALFGDNDPVPAAEGGGLSGLAKALLAAYELIDSDGKPHRYEPDRAVKPLSSLFQTVLAQVGGTYLACRLALDPGPGFCYYLGGGMHHARYDSGSGFCLLNDIAVAVRKLQTEGRAGLVWIIDLDVHKGDGTAELIHFARWRGELAPPSAAAMPGTMPPCVLTLSVHMARGWPLDAESLAAASPGRAPLVPSDVDIGIETGEEEEYLRLLKEGIVRLEQLSGGNSPDIVLVVDGADVYEHDGLPSSGLLKLSLEQCLARDNFVYRYLIDRNIRSAWIQAGGYGDRAWEPCAYFLGGIR